MTKIPERDRHRRSIGFLSGFRRMFGDVSLLISSVHQLLSEAEGALTGPDPGRMLADDTMRSASEIVLRGAERFMRTPFVGDYNTGMRIYLSCT